jgi:hypothetical protein
MKEFKVLKFLDHFEGLFTKADIDYTVMRNILQLKLTLDARRVPTIIKNNNKRKKEADSENSDKNYFMRSLWVYGVISIFIIPLILMGDNYLFQMSIAFGIVFFMTMSTLISDFSSVLLDVRDKSVLLIRPVNKKTINMAKILHILYYLLAVAGSLIILPLVAILIMKGILFGLLFLIEVIWMNLLVIVLAALFYLVILKYFDGDKLKDIINYSQIVLTLVITIGYQFISRLFVLVDLDMAFVPKWWQYLIIPVWFAGPFELIFHQNNNLHLIVFSLLTILVPLILIVIYIKLMPTFERNLQKLSGVGAKPIRNKKSLVAAIGKLIIKNKEELLMFNFSLSMFKTEREFKLKTYPTLGMSLIFPFIFMINMTMSSSLEEIRQSKAYFFIYFSALLLPTLIQMIQYSDKYQGAWIYYILPIKNINHLHKGVIKAVMLQFIYPLFIFQGGLFIFAFGVRIVPDLMIVLLNMIIYAALVYGALSKNLPFSQNFAVGTQSSSTSKLLIYMFLLAAVGGIHFGLSFIPWFRLVYIIIASILAYFLWKKVFQHPKLA